MNSKYEDDKLDERLRKAVGPLDAEFDAQAWMKAHPEAEQAFCRSTASVDGAPTGETESIQFKGSDRPRRSIYRKIMDTKSFKIGVPAALAAMVIVMVMVFTIGGNPKIAFADAIKQLQGKSYEFVMVVDAESDGKTEKITYQCMVMEPGKMRLSGEMPDAGKTEVIVDGEKALLLLDKMKMAIRIDKQAGEFQDDFFSFMIRPNRSIADLWKLQTGAEKKLESKKIDGVESEGFFTTQSIKEGGTQEITVWADAKSAAPVRVDIFTKSEKDKETVAITLKNFKIIEKPDASLFALTAPAGYRMSGYQTLKELEASKKLGKTTPQGQKILKAIELAGEDKKDEAIETILSVDWKAEIGFSFENHLFTLSEDDFVSLTEEDRTQMKYLDELARLRTLAKEAQSRAIKSRDAKEYAKAEQYLEVIVHLGDLCKGDKLLTTEMVGIALRALSAKERVALYEAQGDAAKVEEAKKQVKQAEEENEAMKKRVKELTMG